MKENNTYNEELGGKNLLDSLRVNPFSIPENFFKEQEEHILNQIRLDGFVDNFNALNEADSKAENVPNGYFDNLTTNIFARIAEQDLKDAISEDGFAVPSHYFDQLNQDIEARISEDKLKSLAPILNFEVPENYFSVAEDQIFAKIAESNLHVQVGEETGFNVPDQYFEEVQEEILAKVLTEKWQTEIGKEHFNVPAGYFDHLSYSILAKTTNTTKQSSTIVTLPRRTNWRKYAAAAAIALFVGVGSYFGLQYNSSSDFSSQFASTEVNLEHVSDEEIISYLAQVSDGEDLIHLAEYASDNKDEGVQLDSEIENKEIEEYLNYML